MQYYSNIPHHFLVLSLKNGFKSNTRSKQDSLKQHIQENGFLKLLEMSNFN